MSFMVLRRHRQGKLVSMFQMMRFEGMAMLASIAEEYYKASGVNEAFVQLKNVRILSGKDIADSQKQGDRKKQR